MKKRCSHLRLLALLLVCVLFTGCSNAAEIAEPAGSSVASNQNDSEVAFNEEVNETELATFGAGCFWCVEAVFQRTEGVVSVISGYMGGEVTNPTYEQVVTGRTGHAEVIQVGFDPAVVSYDYLLSLFWRMHDPTTLNRQGADVGTQYRSALFYHSEAQKEMAERSKSETEAAGVFRDPIVTEIVSATKFYEAEEYHQDYFNKNPQAAYCQLVIVPKLRELNLEE